jgi:hypothetical protein
MDLQERQQVASQMALLCEIRARGLASSFRVAELPEAVALWPLVARMRPGLRIIHPEIIHLWPSRSMFADPTAGERDGT